MIKKKKLDQSIAKSTRTNYMNIYLIDGNAIAFQACLMNKTKQ
jgi:hypothetical protein